MLQQSYVYILFPHDKHGQGPHTYYNRKKEKKKKKTQIQMQFWLIKTTWLSHKDQMILWGKKNTKKTGVVTKAAKKKTGEIYFTGKEKFFWS